MADDQEQKPESLLPYEEWTETALRLVMIRALQYAAANGLPGEHHFFLSFRTDHPGVVIPPRLRAQYPEEMTIVLQHQFWNLQVDEEAGLITVGLSFGGVPAALAIPLDAVVGFADPYVQYGLRFNPTMPEPVIGPVESVTAFQTESHPPQSPAQAEPGADSSETAPDATPQVVNLAAFRRRGPTKDGDS